MKQWSAVPLALGLIVGAATPAWAACSLNSMEIPVRIVNQRPIATLTLNGVEVSMLVDSGGFMSMLNASTAKQLNLTLRRLPDGMRIIGYAGDVDAQVGRVEKVGLRGTELSRVDFIVGGNELGSGIQGIVGRNILSIADTEYDLAHGVIRLTVPSEDCAKANLAYWAGQAPVIEVPLENSSYRTDTAIHVNVNINGQKVEALMDTGAPESALALFAAKDAHVDRSTFKADGRMSGAGEGRVDSWIGTVDSFEMGGEKVTHNRMQINDVDQSHEAMIVGLDYFLAHRIYVSRLQKKVYATWNGGSVFAKRQSTVEGEDARYAAAPEAVDAKDADGLARRGTAYAAVGKYEAALADLNKACELAPTVPEHFVDRAQVQLALDQSRPALADLDTALKLNPRLAEARLMRVALRTSAKDRAGALEDLATLDASLSPMAHQRYAMANAYSRLGLDWAPQSLHQWDLWVEHHEDDVRLSDALNARCWVRARQGADLPKAVADCLHAIKLDEAAPQYRDSLGWAYLRQGDAAHAKQAFDEALDRQSTLALSLYGRGLAEQQLHDAVAGQHDLDAARKQRPKIDDDVRDAGFGPAADAPAPSAKSAGG